MTTAPARRHAKYGGVVQRQHKTHTSERGAFAVAGCACGWRGPARRSRDRARADAELHATNPPRDP
ncbi:hypothetical protein [Streptomyces sp. NPDC002133]|uniref:hypothetical protein n=1 Tax=Streptomyces sp. NPDC002133 TaxID=3154409 RepID=UPI003316D207